MTNIERIQSTSLDELANLLRDLEKEGIWNHCSNEFCNQCEEDKDNECKESCKHDDVDVIKWWLSQES